MAPSSVVAELHEISPRLGLHYHLGLHAFLVTLQWLENDPRHAMIQCGDMAPGADFEILFPVPVTVPLDELRGWCAGQLRRVSQHREDVAAMVADEEARLAKINAAVAATAADAAREALLESIGSKTIDVGKRRTRVK